MKNSKKGKKRWLGRALSVALSLALILTGMPMEAFASGAEEVHTITMDVEKMELPEVETSALSFSLFTLDGNKVALKDGNHVEWIERLDLTGADYARDFYNWLVANSNLTDAVAANTNCVLVDPTKGTMLQDGDYVYKVKTFTGTGTFAYTNDAAVDGPAALAAISDEMNSNKMEAVAYISDVYSAFDRDYPEVFWLSGSRMVSYSAGYSYNSQGVVNYEQDIYFILKSPGAGFDIRANEYQDVATLQSAINDTFIKSGNTVDTLLGGVDASATTYEKVQYFNEWLTKNNCYNGDLNTAGHLARESIGALTSADGTSAPVCEAYARAFKVLCDESGIPCVLVDGQAKTSISSQGEGHMWNYVQMDDNNWYAVDVTWNDPTVGGVTDDVSGYEREDYLLVGSDTEIGGMTFIASHPVSNSVTANGAEFTNGPVLAESAYEVPVLGKEIFFDNSAVRWSTIYAYYFDNAGNTPLTWPGVVMMPVEGSDIHYAVTVPAEASTIIFHNGGTAQTPDIPMGEKNCLKLTSSNVDYFWYDYPCNNHEDTNCTNNGNGTHKKVCNNCQAVLNANEAHYGGTATCTVQANCAGCGALYGETSGHDFVDYVCTRCGAADAALVATITVNGADVKFGSLQEAIDFAETKEYHTLRLENSVTSETGFVVDSGNFVLDLNGKTIEVTGAFETALTVRGTLVITDVQGNGKIVKNDAGYLISLENDGQLVLAGGIFVSDQYAINMGDGTRVVLERGYDIQVSDSSDIMFGKGCIITVNQAIERPLWIFNTYAGKVAVAGEGVTMQDTWFVVQQGHERLTCVVRDNELWSVFECNNSNVRFTVDPEADLTYTGSALTPAIMAERKYADENVWEELVEGRDYTVSYDGNVNAGTGTIHFTGIGNYEGEAYTTFTIEPRTVAAPVFVGLKENYTHTGEAVTPAFTLKDDLGNVIPETEYEVAYSGNINRGQATITVSDKTGGNYIVSGTATFNIVQHAHDWKYTVSGATITAICESTVSDCPVGTGEVTLKAPVGLEYDGSAKIATIDGVIDGLVVPEIVYTAAEGSSLTGGVAIHSGTYTASLTLGEGEDAVTASVTFEIDKRTIDSVSFSVDEPVAGATPMTDVDINNSTFVPGVIWSPAVTKFDYDTVYTATVTLTAKESHKFASTVSQEGWTVSLNEDYTVATFTRTFAATAKRKMTGLTAPAYTAFATYRENVAAAIAQLPATVAITLEAGGTDTLSLSWSCENYDATPGMGNTFTWTAENTAYDTNGVELSGSIRVTNAAALAVNHVGTNREITYDGSTYDVADLFTIDTNAGTAAYEVVTAVGEEAKGTLNGSVLTILGNGEITIRLRTAAKGAYGAGEATATLTVQKGEVLLTTAPAAVSGLTYNQSEQALVSAGVAVNGTVMYYVGEDGSDVSAVTYQSTVPKATNAGNYQVWYYIKGSENYNDTIPGVIVVGIAKAALEVAAVPNVAEREYNPSVALADADLVGGSVKGVDGSALAGSWRWQTADVVPTVSNSGYAAVFTPADTTNYKTAVGTVAVPVTKATPVIGSVSASTVSDTTDVSAVTLTCTGASVPGTVFLTDSVLQYGTHTYNWKFTPDAGYQDNYKAITGTVSVTVKDTKAPTATYQVGAEAARECGNITTAFLRDYYNSAQTVTINFNDQGSGVATKQYYVSADILDDTDGLNWTDYTEALTLEEGVHFIYLKVTDAYGNEAVLVTKGMLIYEESTLSSDSIAYTYKENKDAALQITLNGNTFGKLTDGNGTAISQDAYTVDNTGKLTLKKAYLDTLDKGAYTYKITMNPQGVETDAVTLCDTFTVNVSARQVSVTGATATGRDYNGTATVAITAVSVNGIVTGDDAAVLLNGLQGTVSSANAGTYTSVILPALTLTGADAGNYTLIQPVGAVTTSVTIHPLDAVITLGASTYNKTFGDGAFALDVTDNNPEADVQYSVTAGNDVVTVANGTVTILKAGEATITVSMPASTNYGVAVSKTITINVAKKDGYTVEDICKEYLYVRENEDRIDLTGLVPADCGTANFVITGVAEGSVFSVAPTVNNGILTYTVAAGQISDAARISLKVSSDNYEDFAVKVIVVLVDKIPVSLQTGTSVTLKNAVLTYGEALSKLEFENAVFVAEGSGEVAGTLSWKDAATKPGAGTANATWVFTPASEEFMTLEGTVAITVNKAVPNVTAVATVATRVYHPTLALMGSDLTGGTVLGVEGNALSGSWSWQTAGTVPTVGNTGYAAVFTPDDVANYETVTKSIQVTVTQATPVVGTKPVAAGIVYGSTLEASVLTGGAVQYSVSDNAVVAGSFAWKDTTVKPVVADSNLTAYAVVFTPADTVNYKVVETMITLTVEKAENAPNLPEAAMNVSYTNEKVADVTLPAGWTWQDADKEKLLAIGMAVNATAVYTGEDALNYENVSVLIAVTRLACEHSDTEVRDSAPATCVQEGYTGDTYCKECGVKVATGSETPKVPHNYTDTITKYPTEYEEGVRTYTCTKCNHSYTEAIAKLDPEPDWEEESTESTQQGTSAEVAPVIHVVQSGDTLWALARKYGCTVKEIVVANSGLIRNANEIQVGWPLTIPQKGDADVTPGSNAGGENSTAGSEQTQTGIRPQLYVVQSGDSLWKISRKYGCSVKEIVLVNKDLIRNPELIYAGWELKIPQK